MARTYTTAALTLYVAASDSTIPGNDSNDGLTVGNPLATLGKARGIGMSEYDAPGVRLKMADGRYYESLTCFGAPTGGPMMWIEGNKTVPNNVIWTGTGVATVSARDQAILGISGVTLVGSPQLVLVGQEGIIDLDDVLLAGCPGGAWVQANEGGYVNVGGNGGSLELADGAAFGFQTNLGGIISLAPGLSVYVRTGFSLNKFLMMLGGKFIANGVSFTGPGVSAFVAQKYLIDGYGVVQMGATVLPGNVPGTAPNGLIF